MHRLGGRARTLRLILQISELCLRVVKWLSFQAMVMAGAKNNILDLSSVCEIHFIPRIFHV